MCGFLVPKSGSVLWEMMGLATLDLKRDLKLKMKFVNEEEGLIVVFACFRLACQAKLYLGLA